MECHRYELFGNRTVHIGFYKNVQNSASLRGAVQTLDVEVALMNARLIVHAFQIHTAAARAFLCDQTNKLTTKTLHAELVFNLSGTRNVAESFRRFGISESCDQVILCVIDANEATLEAVSQVVQGTLTPLPELGNHLEPSDITLIKKYYKIQDLELSSSSLLDAITSRIATKSCAK
ncbi:hypothetical protein Poli38472_003179 [Pythium oligandrum]|uniref:EKC/KEOPS complex subunit CGI121 n=1 Tax=Pythium oligandrum TaxID=41045 RepID=A0A8K1FDT7_PYTOL|nr:hypothetical protein Poli38472_003179 [Pythium oligandrum]|eukprot:TMW57254.1 hypothetical protein Poli38472_003179 [Pythium oligandrum]